jgi:hypothetical protein
VYRVDKLTAIDGVLVTIAKREAGKGLIPPEAGHREATKLDRRKAETRIVKNP